ncbi:MAG: hypothetical protein ACJ72W_19540, partial [Actinoallomurus sp.]
MADPYADPDYILGVDVQAMYDLSSAWRSMASAIDTSLASMKSHMQGMRWNGDAAFAVRNAWGDGATGESSLGLESANTGGKGVTDFFVDARNNANSIADSIHQYADKVLEAEKTIKKNIIVQIIVEILSLGAAFLPLGGLFRLIDIGLSKLTSVIAEMAGFGELGASITEITANAVAGGVIST